MCHIFRERERERERRHRQTQTHRERKRRTQSATTTTTTTNLVCVCLFGFLIGFPLCCHTHCGGGDGRGECLLLSCLCDNGGCFVCCAQLLAWWSPFPRLHPPPSSPPPPSPTTFLPSFLHTNLLLPQCPIFIYFHTLHPHSFSPFIFIFILASSSSLSLLENVSIVMYDVANLPLL